MTIDIIGLGESVHEYDNANNTRIGVNDANRHFPCHHLVVLNNVQGFPTERRQYIKGTDSHVHTINSLQSEVKKNCKMVTAYKLTHILSNTGKAPLEIDIDKKLYHSRTSPFVALGLAYQMGAAVIRCWGVDLKTHHAYSTGELHDTEVKCWALLLGAIRKKGVEVTFPQFSKLSKL